MTCNGGISSNYTTIVVQNRAYLSSGFTMGYIKTTRHFVFVQGMIRKFYGLMPDIIGHCFCKFGINRLKNKGFGQNSSLSIVITYTNFYFPFTI